VQRELEDLAAVLDAAGGEAHVFGASSGGALAPEAAAAGLPIVRLVVYDVPYSVAEDAVERWRAYRAELDEALAQARIDEALAAFARLGGASDDEIAGARAAPFWDGLRALAPTLAHAVDAAAVARRYGRSSPTRKPVELCDPRGSGSAGPTVDDVSELVPVPLQARGVRPCAYCRRPRRASSVASRIADHGSSRSDGPERGGCSGHTSSP
jgi:pimeloyl-ACP methyl ester carboxylesterase